VLNSSLVEKFEPADQVPWAEAKARFEIICQQRGTANPTESDFEI
jgi:hypothetical protein